MGLATFLNGARGDLEMPAVQENGMDAMTAPARHIAPHWPAMMSEKTAAQYLDMSAAEFTKSVGVGTMPAPVMIGRRPRWAKIAIDAAIAQLAGVERDWRAQSPLFDAA